MKGSLFNEERIDAYNDINEKIDDVEIMRGPMFSNEEI